MLQNMKITEKCEKIEMICVFFSVKMPKRYKRGDRKHIIYSVWPNTIDHEMSPHNIERFSIFGDRIFHLRY